MEFILQEYGDFLSFKCQVSLRGGVKFSICPVMEGLGFNAQLFGNMR